MRPPSAGFAFNFGGWPKWLIMCSGDCERLHTWILCHSWWWGDASRIYAMPERAGPYNVASVSITLGLICSKKSGARPQGEQPPAAAELIAPGGAPREMLA